MSKLLKSKLILGLVLAAVLVVGGTVSAQTTTTTTTVVASAYTYSGVMKAGMSGPGISTLQAALNEVNSGTTIVVDGKFGPATTAAVMKFQASKGLVADGVVGPRTGAALTAATVAVITVPGGPFPAGCTSNVGFSVTTGMSCVVSLTLPAGCTTTAGFSPVTGVKCSGSTTSTGTLSGGAGDLDLSATSTDVEDTLKEGDEDVKIFGVKAEADGSDVAITSIKVTFKNCDAGSCGAAGTSENFENYIDEVTVWLDGTKVGSADADSFSKESGTPDEFSKTISLSGAVVSEDDDAKLYVAVSAASTIDTDDLAADWEITLNTVRFTDATGAILTADVGGFDADGDNDAFTFEDVSADDEITLKSSSANPDDATVKVEESSTSDEVLALAFKLDVDDESSDVMITSIPFTVTFTDLDTDSDGDSDGSDDSTSDSAVESAIDSIMVKIGSTEYEADLDSGTAAITDGNGTADYVVDFDGDEFTIEAGDVTEVKVYVTFNDQEDNYVNGATVVVSLANEDIDAETEEDEVDVDGSDQTGAELTLNTSVAEVSSISWVASGGGAAAGSLDFFFTVEANDGDVSVTDDDVDAADTLTATGSATIAAAVVTLVSGDASGTTDAYTVAEGDTATFRVRYAVAGSAGSAEVRLTEIVGQPVPDTKELSPTIFVE